VIELENKNCENKMKTALKIINIILKLLKVPGLCYGCLNRKAKTLKYKPRF